MAFFLVVRTFFAFAAIASLAVAAKTLPYIFYYDSSSAGHNDVNDYILNTNH